MSYQGVELVDKSPEVDALQSRSGIRLSGYNEEFANAAMPLLSCCPALSINDCSSIQDLGAEKNGRGFHA